MIICHPRGDIIEKLINEMEFREGIQSRNINLGVINIYSV